MVNATIRAFFHLLRGGRGLFVFLSAGLLGLILGWDLLGTVKQLETLPDDNNDQGSEDYFRKAQHIRSQSTQFSVTQATAMSHL